MAKDIILQFGDIGWSTEKKHQIYCTGEIWGVFMGIQLGSKIFTFIYAAKKKFIISPSS
jgi:hypothetical protein